MATAIRSDELRAMLLACLEADEDSVRGMACRIGYDIWRGYFSAHELRDELADFERRYRGQPIRLKRIYALRRLIQYVVFVRENRRPIFHVIQGGKAATPAHV